MTDPRCVCTGTDEELAIVTLLRFDAQIEDQLFVKEIQTCPICCDEVEGRRCIKLPCTHFSCEACMKRHCAAKMETGDFVIPCVACQESVPLSILRAVLGGELQKPPFLFSLELLCGTVLRLEQRLASEMSG